VSKCTGLIIHCLFNTSLDGKASIAGVREELGTFIRDSERVPCLTES